MKKLENKITLSYTETFLNNINLLCVSADNAEWSGVLIYKILKEEDLNFDIELTDIYLMDIGTTATTSYAFDGDVITYFADYYMDGNYNMGHIHSHNYMSVFFSGVDDLELETNSDFHKLYLSVIVNNNLDITCKLTIKEHIEIQSKCISSFGYGKIVRKTFNEDSEEIIKHIIEHPTINIKSLLPISNTNTIIDKIYSIRKLKSKNVLSNYNGYKTRNYNYKNQLKSGKNNNAVQVAMFPDFIEESQQSDDYRYGQLSNENIISTLSSIISKVATDYFNSRFLSNMKYKNKIKAFVLAIHDVDRQDYYAKVLGEAIALYPEIDTINEDEIIYALEVLTELNTAKFSYFFKSVARYALNYL